MHFDAIGRVPGDPILGLMEAYAQDPNPRKFDLGVGVYKDAQGLTPIPEAVKIAEARLVESQDTKTYIGGHGNPLFGKVINELVLGADSKLIAEPAASIGIGALLAGSVQVRPDEKVCVVLTGGNWDLCDLAEVYAGG